MTSGIYMIFNTANLQTYIGSTGNSFEKRWATHKSSLKRGDHYNQSLQEDWNLYGEKWFVFEILEEIRDKDKIIDCEQKWLNKFLDLDKKLYNNKCNIRAQQSGKLNFIWKKNIRGQNVFCITSTALAKKTAHILGLVKEGEQVIIQWKGIEIELVPRKSERETLEEALERRRKSNEN